MGAGLLGAAHAATAGFQDFVDSRINLDESDPTFQPQYFDSTQAWTVNGPMTGKSWAAQARLAIDPQTCINIQGANFVGGTSVQVFNNCPVALVVVSFVVHNVQTGQQFEMPCIGDCEVQSMLYNGGMYRAFTDQLEFLTDNVNLRWF